jgi:hypothetical protein
METAARRGDFMGKAETEDWKTTDGRLELRGRGGKAGGAGVSSLLRGNANGIERIVEIQRPRKGRLGQNPEFND